jgi:hypothetical protein
VSQTIRKTGVVIYMTTVKSALRHRPIDPDSRSVVPQTIARASRSDSRSAVPQTIARPSHPRYRRAGSYSYPDTCDDLDPYYDSDDTELSDGVPSVVSTATSTRYNYSRPYGDVLPSKLPDTRIPGLKRVPSTRATTRMPAARSYLPRQKKTFWQMIWSIVSNAVIAIYNLAMSIWQSGDIGKVIVVVAAVICFWGGIITASSVFGTVSNSINMVSNNVRYESPHHISQADVVLGYHDDALHPSTVTVSNIRGRLLITICPGDDQIHPIIFVSPETYPDPDADNLVATISTVDDPRSPDHKDIIVSFGGHNYTFTNDGKSIQSPH